VAAQPAKRFAGSILDAGNQDSSSAYKANRVGRHAVCRAA